MSFLASVASAAIAPDGNYAVDKDHANVGFSVSHLGISNVIGRFNIFDGDLVFAANGESSVNFTIDAASVDTNQDRRDKHIRSDDFFAVDSFPTINFVSKSFEYSEAGDPKSITGELDFHGVKKSVTFQVEVVGSGEFPQGTARAGYKATTVLKRSEFGIDTFAGVVGEEITVTVNLEIIKQ